MKSYEELNVDELNEVTQAYKDDFENEDVPEDKDIKDEDLRYYYEEHDEDFNFNIEAVRFVLHCDDEKELPDVLRRVAEQIEDGYTSGYYPTWTVEKNI